MQDPVPTDSTELLRTLIRNACVNDGDVASGQKGRNVDALEAYFAGSGLWCERYNCLSLRHQCRSAPTDECALG